jgi:TatD DNase family protein
MYIDTHCHLDWESYQDDLSQVLERARTTGVERIVTIGVDEASTSKTRNLLRYETIFRCVGYHPDVVLNNGFDQHEINRLMLLLEQELLIEKTVGIGECGLDYYTIDREGVGIDRQEELKDLQRDLFERQVLFAVQHSLPLTLHVRDEKSDEAYSDVLDILSEYFGSGSDYDARSYQFSVHNLSSDATFEETAVAVPGSGRVNGVLHCVSGSLEYVQAGMQLGFLVSFAGNVTFKNAEHLQELARRIPLEYIVIETDGPFLAPIPYRGKRNEPAYVVETAKKIAELKGVSLDDVQKITTENALRLFNLS